MDRNEENERFMRWWAVTGGGRNTLTMSVSKEAFICGARMERMAAMKICDNIAGRYPIDIFPVDGDSLDCKSAAMARLTADNIKNKIRDGLIEE